MKDNTTLSNNQIYARLYQEILRLDLEPSEQFFNICRNLYSPQRCIDVEENVVKQHFILHFIKVKGYRRKCYRITFHLPIQYKMWLTND